MFEYFIYNCVMSPYLFLSPWFSVLFFHSLLKIISGSCSSLQLSKSLFRSCYVFNKTLNCFCSNKGWNEVIHHHWAENVAIFSGTMISPTLCVFERQRSCVGWGMCGNRGEVGYLSLYPWIFVMLLTHTHVVQFLCSAEHKRRFWGTLVTKPFWWPLTSIVYPKHTDTFFKI